MAIENYIVAFNFQQAGSGYNFPLTKSLGAKEEATVAGESEFEGKGAVSGANAEKSGLVAQVGSNVAQCYMVELLASSIAEAVEVVRKVYGVNTGGVRAVVKPNETNFKVVN